MKLSNSLVAGFLTLLTLFFPLNSNGQKPSGAIEPPCCAITALDTARGLATGRENSTGRTFDFMVMNQALLHSLKVGQAIYANFKTNQVSVDGVNPCCRIISVAPPQGAVVLPTRPTQQAVGPDVAAVAPGTTGAGKLSPGLQLNLWRANCKQPWLPSPMDGIFCPGRPDRPAVLLVHGMHRTFVSWTSPATDVQYNFDYRHTPPDQDLGNHPLPNAGAFKVGPSDSYDVDQLNWLDYLIQEGFTVAAWSQPCCNFDAAYPSALYAELQFVLQTQQINPAAPPSIALIGHSRGGLVIRKLLKDEGSMGGRVRWVIMLHSPNHGTQLARVPDALADQASQLFNHVVLPANVRNPLRQLAITLLRPLNQFIDEASRELAPDSPLITAIEKDERPVAGVNYYTFGGVNPTIVRLYTWLFTPMSAVPQYKGLEQYFDWQVKAAEVSPVSPMLNKVRAVVPEIEAGYGDSLVTDQSARLAFSVHQTDQLNHAEVMWDRPIQARVVQILTGAAPTAATAVLPQAVGKDQR